MSPPACLRQLWNSRRLRASSTAWHFREGKIVIARYYHSWRGISQGCREHAPSAAYILDPHEDGFYQGETFPAGPSARPMEFSAAASRTCRIIQATRSRPALAIRKTPSALKVEEGSHGSQDSRAADLLIADAQPLLVALTGRVAPEGWRGGLGITTTSAPAPQKFNLKVKSDWSIKPIYDVIEKFKAHVSR